MEVGPVATRGDEDPLSPTTMIYKAIQAQGKPLTAENVRAYMQQMRSSPETPGKPDLSDASGNTLRIQRDDVASKVEGQSQTGNAGNAQPSKGADSLPAKEPSRPPGVDTSAPPTSDAGGPPGWLGPAILGGYGLSQLIPRAPNYNISGPQLGPDPGGMPPQVGGPDAMPRLPAPSDTALIGGPPGAAVRPPMQLQGPGGMPPQLQGPQAPLQLQGPQSSGLLENDPMERSMQRAIAPPQPGGDVPIDFPPYVRDPMSIINQSRGLPPGITDLDLARAQAGRPPQIDPNRVGAPQVPFQPGRPTVKVEPLPANIGRLSRMVR